MTSARLASRFPGMVMGSTAFLAEREVRCLECYLPATTTRSRLALAHEEEVSARGGKNVCRRNQTQDRNERGKNGKYVISQRNHLHLSACSLNGTGFIRRAAYAH